MEPPEREITVGRRKDDLIAQLRELSELYFRKGETYRANTFQRVAGILESKSGPIPFASELKQIRGIGPSSIKIIREWQQTGRISRLDDLRRESTLAREQELARSAIETYGPELYDSPEGRTAEEVITAQLNRVQNIGNRNVSPSISTVVQPTDRQIRVPGIRVPSVLVPQPSIQEQTMVYRRLPSQPIVSSRPSIAVQPERSQLGLTIPRNKRESLALFRKIHGVGPKTAEKWYQRGWQTLEDLRQHRNELTSAQQIGLDNLESLQERIPRSEIQTFESYLQILLPQEFQIDNQRVPGITWMIAGSYRRGALDSGDIDLLIMERDGYTLEYIVQQMRERNLIVETLSLGPSKFMGLVKLGPEYPSRRLDIRLTPAGSWPFATLYFTGSVNLNVRMRVQAESLGYRLNEYGLFDRDDNQVLYCPSGGPCQNVTTEEQIFEILGMEYFPPEARSI